MGRRSRYSMKGCSDLYKNLMASMNYSIKSDSSSIRCKQTPASILAALLAALLAISLTASLCPAQRARKGNTKAAEGQSAKEKSAKARQELNETTEEIGSLLQRVPTEEDELLEAIGNIKSELRL